MMVHDVSRPMGSSAQFEMDNLKTQIDRCMLVDQARLARRLHRLSPGAAPAPGYARLKAEIQRSVRRRAERRARLPNPSFPESLPISAHRELLAETIANHPVTIVVGETGSGKSTQLPKIALSLGRGVSGFIAHTQPRRLAARSIATRIAEELDKPLGDVVGYKVRFDAKVNPRCHIKVVTDGILLAEIQSDRHLAGYDTVIVDEAHERSLNIDFILGYLKSLLPKRPDLRVIVSSATLDTERFSAFFDAAPIVEVSGRSFPVELRYRPPEGDGDSFEAALQSTLTAAVLEVCEEGPGDVLAFFSGEREIREAAHLLRGLHLPNTEILTLYARLPFAQQQRIFKPRRARRIVLATNVAETSLTVPNVRYVIDLGRARIGRYSHRSTVQRLPVEPISKAAAEQRKGRCGRVAPGLCLRLYSEQDFEARAPYTEPEIKRTNLAAVVLQMRALGLNRVEDFPFLDPPDRRNVNDAQRLLQELGALDEASNLTDLGRRLARLPLDPRIGRMLLEAGEFDCVAEVLVIASALSVPDPREHPAEARAAARVAHQRYQDERSDFVSLLNLWHYYHEQARSLSSNRLRALCRKRFLSVSRMREWQEVHQQLEQAAREMGLRAQATPATYSRIHRALLAGLLRHVGFRSGEREYSGIRDTTFKLSPASGQYGRGAKWIVAAELIETSELYAHTVARVRAEWIERAARGALRRSYFDAYWDARRAEVMVFQQSAVFGLVVVPKRRVRYGPVSRAGAREIFIRSALIEGGFAHDVGFIKRNADVIEALRADEAKLRRPGSMLNDEDVFRFYDHVVPEAVCDGRTFEGWRKRVERDTDHSVLITAQAIRRSGAARVDPRDYPDELAAGEYRFALRYRFEPGNALDGVSVEVGAGVLGELDGAAFEWLVPGMLREKVLALLKGVPKALRRQLSPLTSIAEDFVSTPQTQNASLSRRLAEYVRQARGVLLPDDAFDGDTARELPAHLRMNVVVVDDSGATLGYGRCLQHLQRQFAQHASPRSEAAAVAPGLEDARAEWRFEELERPIERVRGEGTVPAYPALVDRGDAVVLAFFESKQAADECHRDGLRRLFSRAAAKELRAVKRALPDIEAMCLIYATTAERPDFAGSGERLGPACAELKASLLDAIVMHAFAAESADIRSTAKFQAALAAGKERLPEVTSQICSDCMQVLVAYQDWRRARRHAPLPAFAPNYLDMDRQVSHLVYRGFVKDTPAARLGELPRYLRALILRLEKLHRGGARDSEKMLEFQQLWERYAARARSHAERGRRDPELARYRWMLEEYRISVFTQELGTAHPVSRKRLDQQWQRVAA